MELSGRKTNDAQDLSAKAFTVSGTKISLLSLSLWEKED